MRIGIMLRHYDQHGGGVRVYTHRILRAMLDLKTAHEFVFLYKNPALVGTYANDPQVTEVALPRRQHFVVGSSRGPTGHQEASASTCSTIPSIPCRCAQAARPRGCAMAWTGT